MLCATLLWSCSSSKKSVLRMEPVGLFAKHTKSVTCQKGVIWRPIVTTKPVSLFKPRTGYFLTCWLLLKSSVKIHYCALRFKRHTSWNTCTITHSDLRPSYQHNLFGRLMIYPRHYYTVTAPSIFTLLVWVCSMQILMRYETAYSNTWRDWPGMPSIKKRREQQHTEEMVLSGQKWYKLQILRDGLDPRNPILQY